MRLEMQSLLISNCWPKTSNADDGMDETTPPTETPPQSSLLKPTTTSGGNVSPMFSSVTSLSTIPNAASSSRGNGTVPPHVRVLHVIRNLLIRKPVNALSSRKQTTQQDPNKTSSQNKLDTQNSVQVEKSLRRHHSMERNLRGIVGVPLFHFIAEGRLPESIMSILARLYETSGESQSVFVFRLCPLRSATDAVLKEMDANADEALRDVLDTPVKTLAAALKSFLRAIPDGLLCNEDHFQHCDESDECVLRTGASLLQTLPKENATLLSVLLVVLKKISESSHVNQMDAHALASVLVPAFGFRVEDHWPGGGGGGMSSARQEQRHRRVDHVVEIVEHLICNAPTLLGEEVFWRTTRDLQQKAEDLNNQQMTKTSVGGIMETQHEESDMEAANSNATTSRMFTKNEERPTTSRQYSLRRSKRYPSNRSRKMSKIPSVSMNNLAEQSDCHATLSLFETHLPNTGSRLCQRRQTTSYPVKAPEISSASSAPSPQKIRSQSVIPVPTLHLSNQKFMYETAITGTHSHEILTTSSTDASFKEKNSPQRKTLSNPLSPSSSSYSGALVSPSPHSPSLLSPTVLSIDQCLAQQHLSAAASLSQSPSVQPDGSSSSTSTSTETTDFSSSTSSIEADTNVSPMMQDDGSSLSVKELIRKFQVSSTSSPLHEQGTDNTNSNPTARRPRPVQPIFLNLPNPSSNVSTKSAALPPQRNVFFTSTSDDTNGTSTPGSLTSPTFSGSAE